MRHFPINEIKEWDRFYRGNFVNSLSGFKSVSLIGTLNDAGLANLAIFSNIVHLGADPALIGFINRPLQASPHTIANIEATGLYSINHIHQQFADKAHQTSAKYEADENEFVEVGLTEEYKPGYKVPFVAESNVKFVLKFVETIPIKLNNTFLVIGELLDVFLAENYLENDGFINLQKAGSMASLGVDGYYSCNKETRYEYAKPGMPTVKKSS